MLGKLGLCSSNMSNRNANSDYPSLFHNLGDNYAQLLIFPYKAKTFFHLFENSYLNAIPGLR